MRAIEIACVLIVAMYVAVRLRRAPGGSRWRVASRLGLLATAGFAGEDSVIRAYDFYRYDPTWSVFLDRVPLLIVVIWPIVIDSAAELAKSITTGFRAVLLSFAIILADASLIEPIAVHAGLWRWSEPGAFAVPPIGVLGWAFFGAAAIAWLERARRARDDVAVVLVAPLAAHVLLIASWWGGLRFISGSIAGSAAATSAWAVLLPVALIAWQRGLRRRIPMPLLLLRLPGAAFFFVLLAAFARDEALLVAYALAFAPPYLALLRVERVSTRRVERSW